MNGNVKAFFERYDSDPALRKRVKAAEDMYPGSFEMREALVSDVLLPVARELGLDFTVEELREYEEELWQSRHVDAELSEEQMSEEDDEEVYWLVGRGWTYDEARFCGG